MKVIDKNLYNKTYIKQKYFKEDINFNNSSYYDSILKICKSKKVPLIKKYLAIKSNSNNFICQFIFLMSALEKIPVEERANNYYWTTIFNKFKYHIIYNRDWNQLKLLFSLCESNNLPLQCLNEIYKQIRTYLMQVSISTYPFVYNATGFKHTRYLIYFGPVLSDTDKLCMYKEYLMSTKFNDTRKYIDKHNVLDFSECDGLLVIEKLMDGDTHESMY